MSQQIDERMKTVVIDITKSLLDVFNERINLANELKSRLTREEVYARLSGNDTKLRRIKSDISKLDSRSKDCLELLKILKNISFNKNIDSIKNYMKFNCFYNGKEIFYTDEIFQYSNKEIKQIILNHIFNILNGFVFHNRTEDSMKSYNLLLFSSLKFIPQKITFGQKDRTKLYKLNKDKIDNLILFGLSKNANLYFYNLAKSNKCSFIKYKSICSNELAIVKNMFLRASGISWEYYFGFINVTPNNVTLLNKQQLVLSKQTLALNQYSENKIKEYGIKDLCDELLQA